MRVDRIYIGDIYIINDEDYIVKNEVVYRSTRSLYLKSSILYDTDYDYYLDIETKEKYERDKRNCLLGEKFVNLDSLISLSDKLDKNNIEYKDNISINKILKLNKEVGERSNEKSI